MYAYQLRQVDRQHEMHLQAWIDNQATATKQQGKKTIPVYRKFKDFFDYEKELKNIEGSKKPQLTNKQRKLAQLAKIANGRR